MTDAEPYDALRWAKYAGQQARVSGRELKSCPMYALGRDGTELRKAWEAGFNSARPMEGRNAS